VHDVPAARTVERARLGTPGRGALFDFDDFDDVPDAKSPFSISAVRSPRDAASSATPVPVMPPPTTRTS